jgi:hypothetical protein
VGSRMIDRSADGIEWVLTTQFPCISRRRIRVRLSTRDFPVAEILCRRILSLPRCGHLTERIEHVASVLLE